MLGLGNNLLKMATKVLAVIRRYWQDEHDLWEAAGNVWEQETGV